ncbi:MAG: MarR family transcriptional regulator [Planctomycetes bacterium]|nr:MarR family transcriptional regulator [Planctomycetota bacterium]
MPLAGTLERIMEHVDRIPGLDAEVIRNALRLCQSHRTVELLVETHLSGQGISARQMETLEALYHHDDQTMTPAELADEVVLTRSAMTSNLDSLERLGYIGRSTHPKDRRMINVTLTPEGRAFCDEALPRRYRDMSRIVACLSSQERQMMLDVYERLAREITALITETKA